MLINYVLWGSISLLLFAYVAYPAVIWVLAKLFRGMPTAPHTSSHQLPSVSLLISAHNEVSCIAARVQNALASDYPSDKLEIVVASDGSVDGTTDVVRRFSSECMRLLEYCTRQGKAATLNKAMETVTSELVVFSDANTHMKPDAIAKLARWFATTEISVVCGRLVLFDARTGQNVDSLYWKYETFLKKCESRLGALLGANGAIYAIRRDRFVPIPTETIVDDFVVPLLSRQQFGGEIIYDDEAVAFEETPPNIRDEFRRRARLAQADFKACACSGDCCCHGRAGSHSPFSATRHCVGSARSS